MLAWVTTQPAESSERSLRDDFGAVAWWVLIGAAAGGIAGFVVGGIGGRLAMLLLRLTSDATVIGTTTDDGFTVGAFSIADSLGLAVSMASIGGMVGVLYAVCRTAIPARLRLPLWIVFCALVGGKVFVHDDGIDFAVLDPKLLAIALFVALPAIAAAAVVLLVERWSRAMPWSGRRLSALLAVGSLVGTFALALAAVAIALALLVRRLPRLDRPLHLFRRVVVPAALAVVGVVAGIDLVQESRLILD
jgi:hypothetical protein